MTDEIEGRITDGARALAARFAAVRERADHFKLVDDARVRQQIQWLRRHRKDVFATELHPAIKESWARTDPFKPQPALAI